jgi:uncharacterized protein YjbI with pentapeptide repeats
VLFYIGIAAGAVTHKDLLLENPVKLPFLGVELPLVAFFVLAPILFIISHAYTLVHFVMLGAKVGVFDAELRAQLGGAPETREGLRQLPSNIFVQFLAGPGDIRKGGLGVILRAIAWVSLVIGPVLLLLLIQAQFLPYHLEWVTWLQRFAVLADVILLWALWPAVLNGRSEINWPPFWRHPVVTLMSLMPIGLAFTAATFPGEIMEDWIGKRQTIPPNVVSAKLGINNWTSFHDLLFNGEVDPTTQPRKRLFSNILVLPGFDALEAAKIDDPKKLDTVKHTLLLHRRHLEKAVFDLADLRKADLEDAHLRGASLRYAHLQGASLNRVHLEDASLYRAQLQGASLNDASLQSASLISAQLPDAQLVRAQIQGTSLISAQLRGASLNDASLQGASLNAAGLEGASFYAASLQGAALYGAKLQGAGLDGAHLEGASLISAQLQGASLIRVHLEGALLISAHLEGASLTGAHLEGADFNHSNLAGTNLGSAAVCARTSRMPR